jgi:hypothetical protein
MGAGMRAEADVHTVFQIFGSDTLYRLAEDVEYLNYTTDMGRDAFEWQMKVETCETVEELVAQGVLIPVLEEEKGP